MERYIKSGGTGAAPALDAGATANFPTPGNAGTGTPAAVMGPYWNHMITEELRQLITDAGLVPSSADLTQVSKAVQTLIEIKSGQYALDTGAADAYVIALNPVPAAYENGMVVRFKAVNANTGAATLDAGAAADPLVNDQGVALQAGDIPAGSIITAVYDSASTSWMITTLVPSQALSKTQADALYAPLLQGQLIGYQIFTVSGAYDKTVNNPSFVVAEVIGAGGGGGGSATTGFGGGGGGAGGYSRMKIVDASLAASETVTIGAGGIAGGASAAGSPGGTSSFGTHCSATGGNGGALPSNSALGGSGGSGVSGDINMTGDVGGPSIGANPVYRGGDGAPGFNGGSSPGANNEAGTVAGNGAANSGAGGGGGCYNGLAGGNGADGIVIIWEYK